MALSLMGLAAKVAFMEEACGEVRSAAGDLRGWRVPCLVLVVLSVLVACGKDSEGSPGVGEYDFTAPRTAWQHLRAEDRERIDAGLEAGDGEFTWVMLHSSGTSEGSVVELDFHHRRVLDIDDGLAYHLVIGNGRGMGDGEIGFAQRWDDGLPGAVLGDRDKERGAISICLIGDFRYQEPSLGQLEALDEILDYLVGKFGDLRVGLRSEVEPGRRDSPGGRFPVAALRMAHPER